MRKIFADLIASFNNQPAGYSARKLSAFAAVIVSLGITVKNTTSEILVEVLWVWLAFALLCLGIITVEQIIRFKESGKVQLKNDANQS